MIPRVLAALALLWPALALAGMRIQIEAEVGPDLAWVKGTMTVHADEPFTLVDPLAALPEPPNDLFLVRTYPGQPEQGVVRFHPLDDHTWSFHAVLPRRYGDIGAIARFGLFGNGGWYPQPLVDEGMPIADWRVRVRIPEGTLGALGETLDEDVLWWEGSGERASLAVVPGGVATPIPIGGEPSDVVLVTRGPARPRLVSELASQLDLCQVEGLPWRGTIVEAPLRRRLARGGRGLAYVSDRAYKVTNGFERFHRVGVTRGVVEGLIPRSDPFVRAVTAAGVSRRHSEALRGPDARRVLGWASWIPTVYGILHSRRMPYYAEILEDVFPGDPVQDDLVEVFDPHAPGTAVAVQVDDRYGPGTSWVLAEGLLLGLSLDRAAVVSGVSPSWLASWDAPYPEQDYRLEVQKDPPLVRVTRDAPQDAPVEAVVVSVDGEPTVRLAGPGPDTLVFVPPDRPRHVALDPGRHLGQDTRLGDRWPPRYHVSFSGAITEINFTELYLYGWLAAYLRRSGNTHDLFSGTLFTSDSTLVGISLRYLRKEGPLLDGLSRPHRIWVSLNPSLLSERYAETQGGRFSLGAGLGYSWTNREGTYFPIGGHTVTLLMNGGFIPGTQQSWARVGAGWTGVASPHPRHAFAMHAELGVARGTVEHRLLSLGGAGGLRSIGTSEIIGTEEALGLLEYRVAPLRNASVPLWLVWGTELQLSVGVEAGTVLVDGSPKSAVGATLGATVLGEVFGFEERGVGVTLAWPLATWGFVSERAGKPQVYLRWGQAF